MKGKNLVIGLVLFIIIVVAAIYFAMTATINKNENGMEPVIAVIDIHEEITS